MFAVSATTRHSRPSTSNGSHGTTMSRSMQPTWLASKQIGTSKSVSRSVDDNSHDYVTNLQQQLYYAELELQLYKQSGTTTCGGGGGGGGEYMTNGQNTPEYTTLKRDYDELLRKYEMQCELLDGHIQSNDRHHTRITDIERHHNDRYNILHKQHVETKSELDNITEMHKNAQISVDRLNHHIHTLQSSHDNTVANHRHEYTSIQEMHKNAEEKCNQLQTQLDGTHHHMYRISELISEVDALTVSLSDAQQQLSSYQSQLRKSRLLWETTTHTNTQLQDKCAALIEDNVSLTGQLTSAQIIINDLRGHHNRHAGLAEQAHSELNQHKLTAADMQRAIESLSNQLTEQRRVNDDLRSSLHSLHATHTSVQQRTAEQQAVIDRQSEMADQHKHVRTQLQMQEELHDELKRHHNNVQETLTSVIGERDELRDQLNELAEIYHTMQSIDIVKLSEINQTLANKFKSAVDGKL